MIDIDVELDDMPFDGYVPGASSLAINSEAFFVVSEPDGLITVEVDCEGARLSIAEAERLQKALTWAIENSSPKRNPGS